ncbi:hypothetical protein OIDMADRAFT_51132 [Oidiodendron maius Zn]|uniref:Grh/CP2 DB domain-containing protein n=1 Tax=Oidiodendron maius (strain Zn) TaxID=913774 RepID=A0A0C3HAP8_OIDMZ|nr:hypothetical protein OIDMADRAFT_51132 [Oidiodendron maius Zn]
MFRHRKNSQKPADGLYAAFRESFPEVRATSTAVTSGETPPSDGLIDTMLDQPSYRTTSHSRKYRSDIDLTPRASHESWNFIPPLPDSNFFSPSNQPFVYTLSPEGTSTPDYNKYFNLATLGIGVEVSRRSPLVLPTPRDGGHIVQMMDTNHCSPLTAQTCGLCHFSPFDHSRDSAPCYLSNHPSDHLSDHLSDDPSDLESSDRSRETPAISDSNLEAKTNFYSPDMNISCQAHDTSILAPLRASAGKFRFHTTLNASTAMIQQADEVPVTYLNKGQIYSVCIADTAPIIPGVAFVQYRTSIRISIGDRQQGVNPETRWNMWKETRGTDEANQHGGKLQGVEYVDTGDIVAYDRRVSAKLENSSLDGFSILWTRGSDDSADCHIAVRFNFLSTDFSYSKGIKGILSQLCAKTEAVSPNSLYASSEPPEVCICNVKVFRDHGAERKHSNDIANVKKSIDKLKQQIFQAETGVKPSRKRKRDELDLVEAKWSEPVKDPRHTRTMSKSSLSHIEDLYTRLQAMQDVFVSNQPVSVFCIRGEEQDDSDPHPLSPIDDLQQSSSEHLRGPPDRSAEAQILQWDSSDRPTRWTRGLQVGPTSRSLLEGLVKPVTCFYICYREPHPSTTKECHQVVYIIKREAKELIAAIAAKCNFDPTSILQVVNVIHNGPAVEPGGDIAHGLPKCCNMDLDLSGIMTRPLKHEWDNVADVSSNIKDARAVLDAIQSEGYFLKLIF